MNIIEKTILQESCVIEREAAVQGSVSLYLFSYPMGFASWLGGVGGLNSDVSYLDTFCADR